MSIRRVRRAVRYAAGAAALAASRPPVLAAQTCPAPHALVLSGGGAKGFAHIGVLEVMDSLGLRPDRIVGTSMGSVVGALYASGYSARQVDSIMQRVDAPRFLTASQPLAPGVFRALDPILLWEQGRGGLGITSYSTLDTRLNAALNDMLLAGNLAAAGDFGRLPIPLIAIGATLTTRQLVLLQHGDLAHAVRASMSIPLVFYPQRIGGQILVDGSVADNTPIAPARHAGARSLTVVDVSSIAGDSVDINSAAAIAAHLLDLFMAEPPDSLGPDDIGIRPDITGLGTLDFAPDRLALAISRGHAAAVAAFAAARCLPHRGPVPGAPSGPFRLAGVTVSAPRPADREYIRRAFGLVPGDTLDLARIRHAYRTMARSAERREVWLNPRREDDGLHLDVTMTPPPRRAAGIAIAVDYDQGGRVGGMLVDRALFGAAFQASTGLSLSRSEQTMLVAVGPAPTSFNPIAPVLAVRGVAERVPQFTATGLALAPVPTSDGYLFVGLEKAEGPWLVQAGPFYHSWHVRGGGGRAAGARLRFAFGAPNRPPHLTLDAAATNRWSRFSADAAGTERLGPWSLTSTVRLGASRNAPLQLTLPLAGSRGFPGYQIFELRGSGEAYAEASAMHDVTRQFRVGADVAGGRSYGSLTDRWLGGLRLAAELSTPLGVLRGGYGWSSSGRRAVFARLGAWF